MGLYDRIVEWIRDGTSPSRMDWEPSGEACAYCGAYVSETRYDCCSDCVELLQLDDGYWSDGMPRYQP